MKPILMHVSLEAKMITFGIERNYIIFHLFCNLEQHRRYEYSIPMEMKQMFQIERSFSFFRRIIATHCALILLIKNKKCSFYSVVAHLIAIKFTETSINHWFWLLVGKHRRNIYLNECDGSEKQWHYFD